MSSNCQRCAKPVHPAEKIGNERAYHKKCFTCTTCRKSLVACSFVEIGASVYCSPCSTKAAPAPIKSTAAGPSKWTPRPSLVSIPDSAPLRPEVLAAPAAAATQPATNNTDDDEIPMTVSQRRASIGAALGSMPQLTGGFRPPVRRLSEIAPAPTEPVYPVVSPTPQLRVALPFALPFAVKRVEAPAVSEPSVTVAPSTSSATSEAASKPAASTLSHATLSRPVIGHHRRRSSHVPPASNVTSAPSELKFETAPIAEETESVSNSSVPVASAAPIAPVAPTAVTSSAVSIAAPTQIATSSAIVQEELEHCKEPEQPKAPEQPKQLEQPECNSQTAVSSPAVEVKAISTELIVEKPVVAAQSPQIVEVALKSTETIATPQTETAPAPTVVKPVAVSEIAQETPASRQIEPVATISNTIVASKSADAKTTTAAAVGKTCLHCGATSQLGAFCACGEPLPVPRSRAGSSSGSISLGQNISLLSTANSTSTNNSVNTSRKSSLAPGSEALAAALAVSASTPSTVNATRTMFQTQAAVTATRLSFSGALPRTSSMSAPSAPVDPNRCIKCNKMAYAAEKMQGTSRTYHKACFKCSACSKSLSSASNGFDRDGQVFCKSCYK